LSEHIVANSYAGLNANSLKKGYVLYNGVDPKFFECITPQKKKEQRKKELGLVDNRPLFISVANLVPYKDYFSVLKALKLLKERSYSYFYLILGDGPLRNVLEQLINNYELNSNVQIFGHVENVKDFLNISDILIHSSKGEGCSNAILEAMASGLPIVASNTGGTKEIVNMENGYLFEYQEVNELYIILKNLLSNINYLKKLGEESKHLVSKKFTVEIMMKNYYEILNLILYSR
jgi:glycosyltransferase involved in cell wall biosynthesis